jgi:hypothetical protein
MPFVLGDLEPQTSPNLPARKGILALRHTHPAVHRWIAAVPRDPGVNRLELEAIIDGLGDMARALDRAEPEDLAELYAALRLSLTYHHAEQIVDVEVDPLADRVDELRVRGGTRTLTTRLVLQR